MEKLRKLLDDLTSYYEGDRGLALDILVALIMAIVGIIVITIFWILL